VDIENEIKETVSEVKTKITTFSAGIVGLTSLLEKVMDMKINMILNQKKQKIIIKKKKIKP